MNRNHLTLALAFVLLAAAGTFATGSQSESEGEYFVILATFDDLESAQDAASVRKNWVLYTSFYSELEPNRFAVVRGPYGDREEAEARAAQQRSVGQPARAVYAGHPSEQLRRLAGDAPPAVFAALLGELRVELVDRVSDGNPCAPQEAYQDVQVTYSSNARVSLDDELGKTKNVPYRRELDLGLFTRVVRSGEVGRLRICRE